MNVHLHLQLDSTTVVDRLRLTPEQIGSWTTQIAGGVLGIVTSLFSLLLEVFTFFVFAFYIAADGPGPPRDRALDAPAAPGGLRHRLGHRRAEDRRLRDLQGRARGPVVVVPRGVLLGHRGAYWLPLALLVGITAQFIPVVGTYIGIAVPVLFVVFTRPLTALWIVLFATVYQQLETTSSRPASSKRTMDVNPDRARRGLHRSGGLRAHRRADRIPLAAAVVAVVETYGRRYELVPVLAAPSSTRRTTSRTTSRTYWYDEDPAAVEDEPRLPSTTTDPGLPGRRRPDPIASGERRRPPRAVRRRWEHDDHRHQQPEAAADRAEQHVVA